MPNIEALRIPLHQGLRNPRIPSGDDALSPSPFMNPGVAANAKEYKWLSVALRERIAIDGYTFADFRADMLAGCVVGMVSMPLGMALGIATGVAPQYGLYTVIVGGFIAALFGGSRFQVSGPTAAFVVILEPIVVEYGLPGLLTAGVMSGVIMLAMGVFGMGQLIHYMPDTVKFGFTSGIAVTIGAQQLKDFLGVSVPANATHFLDIIAAIYQVLPSVCYQSVIVALSTLSLIVYFPRISTQIPAPLVAIFTMTLAVYLIEFVHPSLHIVTIGTRFTYDHFGVTGQGIPPFAPEFAVPWQSPDWETLWALFPLALKIAMLGSIESLLSAVIADGMAEDQNLSTRHNPDCELIGIGIANMICPFFGGIPATGAIARTATNIRFGAKSPIAAMIHSGFALISVVFLSAAMGRIPMAALAALLLYVAYTMGEPALFVKLLKTSPSDDQIVLLSCFILTIGFDMIVGVFGGLIIAAVLFAKQMTGSVRVQRGIAHMATLSESSGKEIVVYEMTGPLFFGTARHLGSTLEESTGDTMVNSVVLIMDAVPVMDVSGAVALTSGVDRLLRSNKTVFIVGIRPQPLQLMRHYLPEDKKGLHVMDSMLALHAVVDRLQDIPSTPQVRWMNQAGSEQGFPDLSPFRQFVRAKDDVLGNI